MRKRALHISLALIIGVMAFPLLSMESGDIRIAAASKSQSNDDLRLKYGARAAYVLDVESGNVLFEKSSNKKRSIASLTKLMTAMVFLDLEPELDAYVKVAREDLSGAGRTQLRRSEQVERMDLLYHSLMSSDNAATRTLVRTSGISKEEFLKRMNRKATILGLNQTRFTEFTGLEEGNVSCAADMAQLLRFALRYDLISKITSEKEYSYRSKTRNHRLVNTNRLVRYTNMDIRGGKTGYIRRAGWCLATWVRQGDRDVISVVLGAPNNPARFAETKRLINTLVPEQTSSLPNESSNVGTGL